MHKTFIIAEAGVNHNGSIEIAKKLIEAAANAGADAVKFQTFKTEFLVAKHAPKAEYQKKTTDASESQFDMIKKLELNSEAHLELIKHCKKNRITFLSSPFDLSSINLLNDLKLPVFKIPSGEIINTPYLKKIGALKKDIILSTGMANLGEIQFAIDTLISAGAQRGKITVLHCNTEYPTPYEDVNLSAMLAIKEAFKVKVGYSDHTPGIEIPIAAVALGAEVIEKHFTLDKNMEGPDHKASLEPGELQSMIKAIRNIEKALGTGLKTPSPSEQKNMAIARKSIVAACSIKKGEVFTEKNLAVKRPGTGISPMQWEYILGRKSPGNFKPDELIEL